MFRFQGNLSVFSSELRLKQISFTSTYCDVFVIRSLQNNVDRSTNYAYCRRAVGILSLYYFLSMFIAVLSRLCFVYPMVFENMADVCGECLSTTPMQQ